MTLVCRLGPMPWLLHMRSYIHAELEFGRLLDHNVRLFDIYDDSKKRVFWSEFLHLTIHCSTEYMLESSGQWERERERAFHSSFHTLSDFYFVRLLFKPRKFCLVNAYTDTLLFFQILSHLQNLSNENVQNQSKDKKIFVPILKSMLAHIKQMRASFFG